MRDLKVHRGASRWRKRPLAAVAGATILGTALAAPVPVALAAPVPAPLAAPPPPAAAAPVPAAVTVRPPAALIQQAPEEQSDEGLTVERIYGTSDFSGESVDAEWRDDGARWTAVERDSAGHTELWQIDARTGDRWTLISAPELVPAGESEAIEIEGYSFSKDGRRILTFTNRQRVWRERTKGEYWIFDRKTRELTPLSEEPGWQMFAKFSPDGTRVAFVREHDLFLTDLTTGEERQLTTTGSETIINGTTDWVYEEELGLRDAYRWSPDGRRIAYWQLDQSPIDVFYLVDQSALYPSLQGIRYPKAGTENSRVRVGSLELATGETTWFDVGADTGIYIARMEWAASSNVVSIQRLNRRQNRMDVLLGDARTGETSLLLTETDSAWVDVDDDLTWIRDGQQFIWSSDRSGFRHLYLHERSGELVRPLTQGEWPVTELHGVDEEEGRVYFTAARQSPLTRSVWSVALDGSGEPTLLAGGRGSHSASFGPEFDLFIDRHSTLVHPPRTVLLSAEDGAELRVLEENAELRARVDSLGLRDPEFLTVEAADGTPLNAYVIKPPDFDPAREYPLLLYVYGGPGSQTVVDRWGGSRYLWHQMLAGRGILVASVDNRGTGGRGRAFKKQVYLRLGQLETADQLAAAEQLGEEPWVDEDRIGIWGWSYGGYMSLLTAGLGGSAIEAAVAVAPVSSWKLYDTIYTERFMWTPEGNPEGYEAGAPLTHAAKVDGTLLIVHGTGDDNVHPQNTIRMVHALEEAGKQFEMRLYPNKTHALEGAHVNLFEMITGFLASELAGRDAAEPAPEPAAATAAGGS